MAIERDKATGRHKVTILIPPKRDIRPRPVRTPLTRARGSLLAFLRDLFRGGPNPFLASPIAALIDRQLRIERQARAAGRDEAAAEGLITQIDAALDRHLRDSIDRADEGLDQLDRYADEEEDYLENCRPAAIKASLDTELDRIASDVNGELGPLATEEAKRRVALDHFMNDNRLKRTIYWGKPITGQSVYLMIFITVFEFVLNTAFFSGTQRSGMIGGAALAMLLSVTTIVLGIGFGIAFQFSSIRAEGRGWFGRLGAVLLGFATLYYLLLLTLARLAGESGDTRMFVTAAREIQLHPFAGLLDLPALAYFFFSIAVIAGVFFKYIDTMGHFPRIRSHRLALDKAEKEYDEIQRGLIEAARSQTDESLKALEAAPGLIQATMRAISELVMNYENVVDRLKSDMKDVRDAARLLVGVVQQHCGLAGASDRLSLDYSAVAAAEARLIEFRARAARLEQWEEVNPAAVDRCREQMIALGRTKLEQIERRCDEVRQERYRDLGGVAPPLPQVGERDTPAWMPAPL